MGLGTLSLLFPAIAMSYGWVHLTNWESPIYGQACRAIAAYPQTAKPYLARRSFGSHLPAYYYDGIELYGRYGGDAAFRYLWEESERPRALPREVAYYGLAATRRPEALPKLRALLKDPEWQWVGVDTLGWHGSSASIADLVPLMSEKTAAAMTTGDIFYAPREQPAAALALIGASALPELHKAARHPYSVVRRRAVLAIAEIGHPTSAEPLWQLVRKGKAEPTYHEATIALASLGDLRALEPMLAIVQSEGADLPEYARALAALRRDPRAWRLLRKEAERGSFACRAYARAGGTDLRLHWERGLKGDRRKFFAQGLAELRDLRSLPALIAAVGKGGEPLWEAFIAIGKPALPPLRRLLASPDQRVREEAGWILSVMGDGAALPLMIRYLSNNEGLVDELARGMILASVARQVPPYRPQRPPP